MKTGFKEIEKLDHAKYHCLHIEEFKYKKPPSSKICRLCFMDGFARVKAVASGAYCMSVNRYRREWRKGCDTYGVKNFVSEMDLEDKSHRYCCSSYLCNNLEDKEKFLSFEGCITTLRRKYCSGICQRQDSKQHRKYCTKIDSGGKPNVSKLSNKSNKKKKKKQF